MSRRAALVIAVVVAILASAILLLATGGGEPGEVAANDPAGDVKIDRGPNPPRHLRLADIREISVRSDESAVVFVAKMGSVLARRLPQEAVAWRWEVYEADQLTWILSANVDVGPNASILATQTDYSASTVDDTLPGSVSIEGDTITVHLKPSEIEGWPKTFEVTLRTSLDASRTKPSSALVEDRAPQNGTLTVGR